MINFGQRNSFVPQQNRLGSSFNQPVIYDEQGSNIYNPQFQQNQGIPAPPPQIPVQQFNPQMFGQQQQLTAPPPAPPPQLNAPSNRFINMGVPQAAPPPPFVPPQQNELPPSPPPPNFDAEYSDLKKPRPNRLAYQQAVDQGPQQIKRSRWAKLGASLGAGLSALGGESVGNSVEMGVNAINAPQNRANEQYARRIAGLGKLAEFEDTDKSNDIRALEVKMNEFHKQRELELSKSRDKREWAAELRAQGFTDEQIKASQEERQRLEWVNYDDVKDGNSYLVNRKTGERQLIGQTKLTTKEQREAAKDQLMDKLNAEEPFNVRSDIRKLDTGTTLANIGADKARDVAKIQAQSRLAKMNNIAKQLKPGEAATQVWNDLTGAMASEATFADMGDPKDYLDVEGLGTGASIIKVKPASSWDSADDKLIKDRLNQVIAGSYAKSNSNKPGERPPVVDTSGVTPQRGPGTDTNLPGQSKYPTNPDGTVTLISPTGVEKNVDPKQYDVEDLLTKGAKVKGAAPPTAPTPAGTTAPLTRNNPAFAHPEAWALPAPAPEPTPIPPPTINKMGGMNLGNRLGLTPPPPPTNIGAPVSINGPTNIGTPLSIDKPPVGPARMISPGGAERGTPPRIPNPIPLSKPPIPTPGNPIQLTPGPARNISPAGAEMGNAPAGDFNTKLQSITEKVEAMTGMKLRVISGNRDAKKQNDLYKEGKTPVDGYNQISKHQTGEAADIQFVNKYGNVVRDKKLLEILGQVAESEGLSWGGRFQRKDPNHIQAPRR